MARGTVKGADPPRLRPVVRRVRRGPGGRPEPGTAMRTRRRNRRPPRAEARHGGGQHEQRAQERGIFADLRRRIEKQRADRVEADVAEVEETGGLTQAINEGLPKLRTEEAAARARSAARMACMSSALAPIRSSEPPVFIG